jgi:hypothetical protein
MYDIPHSARQTGATPSGDIASASEFPAANRYPQADEAEEALVICHHPTLIARCGPSVRATDALTRSASQ